MSKSVSQDVHTIFGFGTVMTGCIFSGSIEKGSKFLVSPSGQEFICESIANVQCTQNFQKGDFVCFIFKN